MSEYFDPTRSLKDRFAELSDSSEIKNHHNSKVNALVMGLVTKYLCDYLQITDGDVSVIQEAVRRKVQLLQADMPRIIEASINNNKPEGISDAFGVECLMDLRSTAALFKEIAFTDSFEKGDQFLGVDLGSGTGILGGAIAVAALRQQCQTRVVALVDSQKNAIENSTRVLSAVENVQFLPMQFDLRNSLLYQYILAPNLVQFWVSETVNGRTPIIKKLSKTELRWGDNHGVHQAISGSIDPYTQVLENLMNYSPSFYDRVEQKKAALFPDPINGNFSPGLNNGLLHLKTSPDQRMIPLHEVGKEFSSFEDFGVPVVRWGIKKILKNPSSSF